MRDARGVVLVALLCGCPADRPAPPAPPAPSPAVAVAPPAAPAEPAPAPDPAPAEPVQPAEQEATAVMSELAASLGRVRPQDDEEMLAAMSEEVLIDEVDPTIGRPVDRTRPAPRPERTAGDVARPRASGGEGALREVAAVVQRTKPPTNEAQLQAAARELAAVLEAARARNELTVPVVVAALRGLIQLTDAGGGNAVHAREDVAACGKLLSVPVERAIREGALDGKQVMSAIVDMVEDLKRRASPRQ